MPIQQLIDEIVKNFQHQHQYYLQIADLSKQQLSLLTNESWPEKQEELNQILVRRQDINQQIDALNQRNKALQVQTLELLDLPEFVLSRLEDKINPQQYRALRDAVTGLSSLLAQIDQVDEQNHSLLKKKSGPGRIKSSANRQQARNAYQQAVQQGKKSE